MFLNPDGADINSKDGTNITSVDNFTYLGGRMNSPEKGFKIRKAQTWSASHKLKRIWSSNLCRSTRLRLFITIVNLPGKI